MTTRIKQRLFTVILIFIMVLIPFFSVKAEGASPVITLIGMDKIYIEKGATYKEYGATATDAEDGDLTSSIVINASALNLNTIGTYTVSYSVQDSHGNSHVKYRTIIVSASKSFDSRSYIDPFTEQRYYNSSFARFNSVESTIDGGFISVGQIPTAGIYSVYRYAYIAKTNSQNQLVWQHTLNYSSSDEYLKVIELSSGQFLAVGRSSSYGLLALYNSNGVPSSNTWYTNYTTNFVDVVEYDNSGFAVYDNMSSYIYLFTNSLSFVRRFSVPSGNGDILSFGDRNIYYKYESGGMTYLRSYSEMGSVNWSKTVGEVTNAALYRNSSELLLVGNTQNTTNPLLAYAKGDSDVIVIKLSSTGAIISSKTFGGTSSDTRWFSNFNNGKIVIRTNSSSPVSDFVTSSKGISIIDASSLLVVYSSEISDELSSSMGAAINDQNINIVGVSAYTNSYNAFPRILSITPHFQALGLNDTNITYGTSFDLEAGISFKGINGDIYSHAITGIDGTLNVTTVGNQTVYYNINVFTDDPIEPIKHVRIKRTITVEPIINIANNSVHQSKVLLDIYGGSITINGSPYTHFQEYNIPGTSTLTVTGVNGYSKQVTFTVSLTKSGIQNGITYAEPVAMTFSGGTATLNGSPYTSGTTISAKGNYTLVITGANGFTDTTTFTIEPTILGVQNGTVYYESINPSINAETMTLNGASYTNQPITNAGHYTLIITGVGGYTQTLNFTIETTITGITNSGSYVGQVTAEFNKGTATLNGNPYTTSTVITTPGLNTFTVTGAGGYSKTLTFTVTLVTSNITKNQSYVGEITPTFSGGSLTLNGSAYTSGTTVNVPGIYSIVVTGSGGFSEIYNFTVKPLNVNVNRGSTYSEPRIVATSNGTLQLIKDGGSPTVYTSGSVLNESGSYILKIIGVNGYLEEYNFIMAAGSNIVDEEDYISEVTVNFIGDATLNGVSITNGTFVDQIGDYELIIDDDGNILTYQFRVVPDTSVYNSPIILTHIIDIPNADLKLDGVVITNLHEIEEVGSYQLTIEGVDGYIQIIDFDVIASVNIIDQTDYFEEITINAEGGTITLNGDPFIDGTLVDEIGQHTLVVTGENGYISTYIIYVVPTMSDIENNGTYIDTITPIINHDSLLLDGAAYLSGTEITTPGHHVISIVGVNGFVREIEFFILPSQIGIEDGMVYQGSVTVTVSGFTLLLNGNPYTSGTPITSPYGENHFKLVDVNLNEREIVFYLIPTISNVENGETYVGSVTPLISHAPLYLNSQNYSSGTVINTVGHHILKIAGLYGGYEHVIEFTVVENPMNIIDGGQYTGSITPNVSSFATLKLNGNPYTNNTIINTVGHHVISITGVNGYTSSISFTILPNISNVVDGQTYDFTVTPVIPNATLKLNGNNYTSGTAITTVGHHSLEIIGLNGYTQTIEFTVLPRIQNVIDGGIYYSNSPIYPTIAGATLLLNGSAFTSGNLVRNVGNYTLEIQGVGGYQTSINFVFHYVLTGITANAEYTSSVVPNVLYSTLQLNNNPFTSGTTVYSVGYHNLKIIGVGGYEMVISFTIHPSISGVVDLGVYTTSRTITIPYTTSMNLNGNVFSSGQSTALVGNHTLSIFGLNDYVKTITFRIDYILSGVANNTDYTTARTISVSNATLVLNGNPYVSGTSFNLVGNYELKIIGIGEYERIINFRILPVISGVSKDGSYNATITPSIPNTTLTLNDEPYTSGTAITMVGYYTLVINGVGDYIDTVSFTMNPVIVNVVNAGVYTTQISPIINHSVLQLNGEPFISGSAIILVGYYELLITGVNGYTQTILFTIAPVIQNVVDGQTYNQSVTPIINHATLELNDEPFASETLIESVGYYELLITGVNGYSQTILFTITPVIQNVADDQSYNQPISPVIENAALELNGVAFNSGDTIDLVGNYTLVISGVNGYEQTISFVRTPHVLGVNHLGVYQSVVTPIIEYATLSLNGISYDSGTSIDLIGIYVIEIEGINGYSSSVTFTIDVLFDNIEDLDTFDTSIAPTFTFDYDQDNEFDPSLIEVLLNGISFESGQEVSLVGDYELVIRGINNYEKTLHFSILPVLSNVVENQIYVGEIAPVIENATLLLNGNPYTSGEKIEQVGHHILKIIGENGYEQEITFTVNEVVEDLVQSATYDYLVIPKIPNATLLLNDEPYQSGHEIRTVGHNVLKVIGENGYVSTYQFTVTERLFGFENAKEYTSAVNIQFDDIKEVKVNGVTYAQGTPLSQAGAYTVVVYGENGYTNHYQFSIKFNIVGVEHLGVYSHPITPVINATNILLDGNLYTSGTPISSIGHHTLEIIGSGGITEVVVFTIIPTLSNIEQSASYMGSVTPLTNATSVELNGVPYTPNTPINTVGNHTYQIIGTNGYVLSVSFTITELLMENAYAMESNDYLGYVSFNALSTTMEINGIPYIQGQVFDVVGHHILTVYGLNGYSKSYSFTIKPYIEGITNSSILEGEINLNIIGQGTYLIDGNTYVSGTQFTVVGHHILQVLGRDGYILNIPFTITPQIVGLNDNGDYSDSVTLDVSDFQSLLLNGTQVANLYEVTMVGSHILIIYGVNSYSISISFTIHPTLSGIIENGIYQQTVTIDVDNAQAASLNLSQITFPYNVSQAGNHILRIFGVNGYTKDYHFTIDGYVNGIADGQTVNQNTDPLTSNGMMKLNGTYISNSQVISQIGNHTLEIVGPNGYSKVIEFTVYPVITGIESGETYINSVSYNISPGATIKLNGITSSRSNTLRTIGHHILEITGTNDFSVTIPFTIDISITYPINEGVYKGGLDINIQHANLTLNGNPIFNSSLITVPGHYSLQISGTNGYSKVIQFVLELSDEYLVNDRSYVGSVIFTMPAEQLKINGTAYTSGTEFSEVGHHILTIEGVNGYIENVEFTITEVTELISGAVYTDEVRISIPRVSALVLNGKTISSGTLIKTVGNMILVVHGNNGYTSTYEFTIKPDLGIVDQAKLRSPHGLLSKDARIMVNGRLVDEDFVIDTQGTYVIEIFGENGYYETYEITYQDPNFARTLMIGIPTISFSLAGAVWFLIRRRRLI